MQIRRPVAAFLTALTLIGGGALTACGDPVESGTGTHKDTATNTSGNSPSDESQGNVPDNSNQEPSSGGTGSG
jgi:hypothetical protein